MHSYKDIFENKNRILFVMAHPDDVDVFFGGTIARLISDGKNVRVVVVTNGALGSRQNSISEKKLGTIRKKEEAAALIHLGLKKSDFACCNYHDGIVENSLELIGKIVKEIRKFKPDLVCTHNPNSYYHQREQFGKTKSWVVNHRDHRMVGVSTLDAVYPFSRDVSFFRDQIKSGLSSHTVMDLFFTPTDNINTKIDITDVIDKKRNALLEHKSQFDIKKVEKILSIFKKNRKHFEMGTYINLAW
jgi:LmbE family N-acetylglucosaminyl deacetylase